MAVGTDNRDSFDRILRTALTRIDVPIPSFGNRHNIALSIRVGMSFSKRFMIATILLNAFRNKNTRLGDLCRLFQTLYLNLGESSRLWDLQVKRLSGCKCGAGNTVVQKLHVSYFPITM